MHDELFYKAVSEFHILTGIVALFVGPFQFIPYIRRRWLSLHRLCGRAYVGVVLASAPLAFVVSFHSPLPWAVAGTAVQSVCWFVTTLAAYRSIRKLKINEHRRWMVLSFSLTLAAPVLRLGIVALEKLVGAHYQDNFDFYYPCLVWFSFLPFAAAVMFTRILHKSAS